MHIIFMETGLYKPSAVSDHPPFHTLNPRTHRNPFDANTIFLPTDDDLFLWHVCATSDPSDSTFSL